MAIVYPRFLPIACGYAPGSDLQLVRSDAINRTRGGAVDVMELADPFWRLTLVTTPLKASGRAMWQAWLNSLHGGAKRFWGWPPLVQFPLAYGAAVLSRPRAGGGAYDGAATVTAASAYSVSLSGLPASYVATAGDMIALVRTDGSWGLHQVTESTVGSVNGTITLSFVPAIDEPAIGQSARLARPMALFALDHQSISCPMGDALAPVKFSAQQVPA